MVAGGRDGRHAAERLGARLFMCGGLGDIAMDLPKDNAGGPPIPSAVEAGGGPLPAPGLPPIIYLPWPPSTNALYRAVSRGGRTVSNIMSKAYREWRQKAAAEIQLLKPLPAYTGRVDLWITLHPPTERAYDGDNRLKALIDALVDAGIIMGDSNRYIRRYFVTNEPKDIHKIGFASIIIEPVGE